MKNLKDLFTRKKKESEELNDEEPFSIPSTKSSSVPSESVSPGNETANVNPVPSESDRSDRNAYTVGSRGRADSVTTGSESSGVGMGAASAGNSKSEDTQANGHAANRNNDHGGSAGKDGKSVSGESPAGASEPGGDERNNTGGGIAATAESIIVGAAAAFLGSRGSDKDEDGVSGRTGSSRSKSK